MSCGRDLESHRRYDFKSRSFRRIYADRDVYRCRGCGLVQVDMSAVDASALPGYYAHEYRAVAGIGVADQVLEQRYRARGVALADLVARYATTSPKRAFEVGAGYGYNLLALRDRFPDISVYTDELDATIELDPAIRRGRSSDGPWDVVVLSHVVEHFVDPMALLRTAVEDLAPGGLVVIEVPNDEDGIIPINGSDEPHLTFFTQRTLEPLLAQVPGSELVTMFTAGPRNTRRTLRSSVRDLLLAIARKTPLVKQRLARRHARIVSTLDFRSETIDGMFLRAVLRRTA